MSTYKTVVVGTDGSETSFRAVDRAAEVAHDTEATLVLVCAYFPHSRSEIAEYQDAMGDAAYQVVGSAPAEDTLHSAEDRAVARGATDIQRIAVEGRPVDIVLRTASEHNADLIVVGNRGLNTLAGRVLGSVPADVARHADCDVLIVRTKS